MVENDPVENAFTDSKTSKIIRFVGPFESYITVGKNNKKNNILIFSSWFIGVHNIRQSYPSIFSFARNGFRSAAMPVVNHKEIPFFRLKRLGQ